MLALEEGDAVLPLGPQAKTGLQKASFAMAATLALLLLSPLFQSQLVASRGPSSCVYAYQADSARMSSEKGKSMPFQTQPPASRFCGAQAASSHPSPAMNPLKSDEFGHGEAPGEQRNQATL